MKSVLQDWVMELTLMEQGTLVCAMRGGDGLPKEHPTKAIVRAMRGAVMNMAWPRGRPGEVLFAAAVVPATAPNLDDAPHHFVMHLIHAVEVLGYRHPNTHLRTSWLRLYVDLCMKLHLTPENINQMTERLRGEAG